MYTECKGSAKFQRSKSQYMELLSLIYNLSILQTYSVHLLKSTPMLRFVKTVFDVVTHQGLSTCTHFSMLARVSRNLSNSCRLPFSSKGFGRGLMSFYMLMTLIGRHL